jgi:hypothetical protein
MNKLKAAVVAAILMMLGVTLTACGPVPGSRVPGAPGVPTAHAHLIVTVRDSKGNLIVPAESPHWPNVVISVVGADAHGEPPLNWPEMERLHMTENPWERDISWPSGSVAKITAHVQTDVKADVGTTLDVRWEHTDGRPGMAANSHTTSINDHGKPFPIDTVAYWTVAVEGPE